jgi:hypothetical protein
MHLFDNVVIYTIHHLAAICAVKATMFSTLPTSFHFARANKSEDTHSKQFFIDIPAKATAPSVPSKASSALLT